MAVGEHTAGHFGKLRGLLFHAILLLALCLVPLVAEAKAKVKKQPKPDLSMQFAIVRGSSPLCEPNCPEWIWAEGEIRSDTAKRFKTFLKTVGARKLPVIIQSPGGDLDAALAMGRMIRAKKLDVAVGYTTFSSCAPRQKGCDAEKTGGYKGIASVGFAYCNSACPMVLAGGTKRLVGAWAHLGVHQITTTMIREKIVYKTTTRIVNGKKVVKKKVVGRKKTGSYETTKMSKALRRKMEGYLTEMGVGIDLIEPIQNTPAAGVLRLNQSQMLAFKLITSMDQVEALTGLTICKATQAPPNCRMVATEMAKATGQEKTGAKTEKAAPKASASVAATKAPAPAATKAPAPAVYVSTPEKVQPTNTSAMRFVVVRGSSPLCDPNCPEWISAEGVITSMTPKNLGDFLKAVGDRRLPVIISSSGGDIYGALAAGRLIRKHKLDTAVGRTHFIRCAPEDRDCNPEGGIYVGAAVAFWGECREACALLFAGGVRRFVDSGVKVSVRAPVIEQSVGRYLDEMAISPELLSLMNLAMGQPVQLEPETMLEVKLVTGPEEADVLMGSTICKSVPQPANCRVVSAAQ